MGMPRARKWSGRLVALLAAAAPAGCGESEAPRGDIGVVPRLSACAADEDDGIDGSLDGVWSYSYDGDGNLIGEELDEGPDGSIEVRSTYVYENGQLVSELHESVNLTTRLEYEHDSDGNLIAVMFDEDGDGRFDYIATYQYGADGRTRTAEIDRDGDLDRDERWVYHYDADDGLLSEVETDDLHTGTITAWRHYTHDEQGRSILEVHDAIGVGDGEPDFSYAFSYEEEHGFLSDLDIDYHLDGVDHSVRWTYDAEGAFLTETNDDASSEEHDVRLDYRYDCSAARRRAAAPGRREYNAARVVVTDPFPRVSAPRRR